MANRHVYLKIENIAAYNPVDPPTVVPRNYKRDCMRNPGHETGTIPDNEVNTSLISEVALINPGSVTHGWNMTQRFVGLKIISKSNTPPWTITVQPPPDQAVAPAGYYYLVGMFPPNCIPGENNGGHCGPIPSECSWVRLKTAI